MSYSKKLFKDKDNSHVAQNDETRVTEDSQTTPDDQQVTNILIRIENFRSSLVAVGKMFAKIEDYLIGSVSQYQQPIQTLGTPHKTTFTKIC